MRGPLERQSSWRDVVGWVQAESITNRVRKLWCTGKKISIIVMGSGSGSVIARFNKR